MVLGWGGCLRGGCWGDLGENGLCFLPGLSQEGHAVGVQYSLSDSLVRSSRLPQPNTDRYALNEGGVGAANQPCSFQVQEKAVEGERDR